MGGRKFHEFLLRYATFTRCVSMVLMYKTACARHSASARAVNLRRTPVSARNPLRVASAAQQTEVSAEPVCTIEVQHPTASPSTLTTESGENLRRALLSSQVEVYHGMWAKAMNCGGGGSCGTCTVEVLDDGGILSSRTASEDKKLKGKPATWRLACQTLVGNGQNAGACKVKVGPK